MQSLSDQVFGNELILSKILSYLSLKELAKSCFGVNTVWNSICHKVIESRTQLDHFFELYRISRHHMSSSQSRNRETHLAEDKHLEFVNECFDDIETKLKTHLRSQLNIWPQIVVTFFGNFCQHSRRPEKLMQYSNGFRRYLPPETQFLNIVSLAGVIGSVIHKRPAICQTTAGAGNTSATASTSAATEPSIEPIETQAHVGNCAGISLLIFPKYPNVEIDIFDERNLIALEKLNDRTDLKCLIVLATTYADSESKNIREFKCINTLNEKYNNKLAIGGIVVDDINYYMNNVNTTRRKTRSFYGLAFSGVNVRACSLLLKTVTPEATEKKFREFRKNLNFDPNLKTCETIGFLFVCTGRGLNIDTYPTSNVEASIFRKVFPEVKLIGGFGQGEYGQNYWPSLTTDKRTQLMRELQDDIAIEHEMWHFYTSVLVLVNLPKK
ncbi:F-box only protein 22-like [Oppia nitens]|uniref:F-box only protein 22-like n=1 Tax=Oppia nitens TaxID=1686743 RepID=UPI0023DB00C0|nr:F-box only protein 22-like [Oppia nitens]